VVTSVEEDGCLDRLPTTVFLSEAHRVCHFPDNIGRQGRLGLLPGQEGLLPPKIGIFILQLFPVLLVFEELVSESSTHGQLW